MVPGTSSFETRVKPDVDSAFPAHDVVRHRAGGGRVQNVSLSDLNAAVGGDVAGHVHQRGCGSARTEEPRSTASDCPASVLGASLLRPQATAIVSSSCISSHLRGRTGRGCWKTFRAQPRPGLSQRAKRRLVLVTTLRVGGAERRLSDG
jgi:hypothetical protein